MKRLNNKGITTIEVLVCFVIVVVITVSMHSTISYYNQKRIIEGYKQKIINYKNLLTQAIQNDVIRIGITHVKVESPDIDLDESTTKYVVNMDLKDSTKRRLVIEQTLAQSPFHLKGSTTKDDKFIVEYGNPDTEMISYDIPKLGSFKNEYGKEVQDLSINNVLLDVVDDRVLSIYIGFYHPEFGTRYAINIVAPIDFTLIN